MRQFVVFSLLCLFLVNGSISLNKERDCKCRIQSKKRIIGGREADWMAYPWQITISAKEQNPVPDHLRSLVPERQKLGKHFCGGSIINEQWIITAGHCLFDKQLGNFTIGFGENDLVKIFEKKQYAEVENYYMHPHYMHTFLVNDIALIRLKKPLTFSAAVQPACLPTTQHQYYYDGILKIIGWGFTSYTKVYKDGSKEEGKRSRYLKEGDVYDDSINQLRCRKDNICLRKTEPGKGDNPCYGDSGSPLHHTKGGQSTVIGLTSFGDLIKDKNGTDIHCVGVDHLTRISYFMDWVKNTVGDDLCE